MKTSEGFVASISIFLAFPVILCIHAGKSFWVGCKYFVEQQKIWWSDIRDDFK